MAVGMSDAAGTRYDESPLGLGKNWVTSVGGLPLFIRAIAHALLRNGHSESEAIQLAVGVVQNWASGRGKVTAKTRAKAAAALAQWEAMKGAAHASGSKSRGIAAVRAALTEASSAGTLLPKGNPPALVARVAHMFASSAADRRKCATCGQGVAASLHGFPRATMRSDGERAVGRSTKRLAARTRRQVDAHAAAAEPAVASAMRGLFAKQATATLSRLNGRRGKTMLRATQPPEGQEPVVAAQQPIDVTPIVAPDAAQIFDFAFWAQQTETALNPVYGAIASQTAARLAAGLHPDVPLYPQAITAARQALAGRVSALANTVTQTTYQQINRALADGLAAGEGVAGLASRVQAVFDDASRNRAETIARTEVMGSMNTAADSYAAALPPGIVATRQWLATPDSRTRHDHVEADGQQRPVGEHFDVGGFPMKSPGDETAPPSETINCRCCLLYLPALKAGKRDGWDEALHPRDPLGEFSHGGHGGKSAEHVAASMVGVAKRREPALTASMQALADKHGAGLTGIQYAVKGHDSLTRKIKGDMIKHQETAESAGSQLFDVNRYTMLTDEHSHAATAQAAIDDLRASGHKVTVKNFWNHKTNPYQGVNVQAVTPGGHPFELQFHTPASLAVKEGALHSIYERARVESDAAKLKEYKRLSFEAAATIPVPRGIAAVH